jgi:hypothetical protein
MNSVPFVWGVLPPSDWMPLGTQQAALVAAASAELEAAVSEYDTTLAQPAASARRLEQLSSMLMGLSRAVGGNLAVPDEDQSELELRARVSPDRLGLSSNAKLGPLLDTFVRYDRYFGTRRHIPLTGQELAEQLAMSGALALKDLADCMIETNELRSLLDGLSSSLATVISSVKTVSPELPAAVDADLESMVNVGDVALRRWRLGHHIFNAFVSFATVELTLCQKSDEAADVKIHLDRAVRLFRGTTAAMWYAEAFPRQLYKALIRPSMAEVSGTATGFSGADNLEFRFLKRVATNLLPVLNSKFGEPGTWPDEVWLSTRRFLETRHLDVEHHTLLAEKVVGLDPSLKQLRLVERDDDGTPAMSAVDSLRSFSIAIVADKESLL